MAVVRTFINDAEASIAASAIEAAGIEVFIHRDAAGGVEPSLDMGGIQLIVPDGDLEAANEVLSSFAQVDPAEPAPEDMAPETAPEE
jgi:hypothetical protein